MGFRLSPRNARFRSTILSTLSKEVYLGLVCTRSFQFQFFAQPQDVWRAAGVALDAQDAAPNSLDEVYLSVPPWQVATVREIAPPNREAGPFETYLRALATAIQNDNEVTDHLRVRELAGSLVSQDLAWAFRPEHLLGPGPDDFVSVADWRRYRQGVAKVFANPHQVEELATSLEKGAFVVSRCANSLRTIRDRNSSRFGRSCAKTCCQTSR
jgi:hypothetical protein